MSEGKNVDRLAEMLIDEKIKGASYLEIAGKHSLEVDEVIRIIRGVYEQTAIKDPVEYRALIQLRLEKLIEKLFEALDNGNMKAGDTIVNAVKQLQELHALNEQQQVVELNRISDYEVGKILGVLGYAFSELFARVQRLELSDDARNALDEWPVWVAEVSTEAIENVIDVEEVE